MKHRSAPAESTHEQWTVDGLEDAPQGRVARLELPDGQTTVLPLARLPEGVQEGDLLSVSCADGELKFTVLEQETAAVHEQAQARLDALNADGNAEYPSNEEITL